MAIPLLRLNNRGKSLIATLTVVCVMPLCFILFATLLHAGEQNLLFRLLIPTFLIFLPHITQSLSFSTKVIVFICAFIEFPLWKMPTGVISTNDCYWLPPPTVICFSFTCFITSSTFLNPCFPQ